MSIHVEQDSLGLAWVDTFRRVADLGGKAVNVTMTVRNPSAPEIPELRAALDQHLVARRGAGGRVQSVTTVASTIFPGALYADPGMTWAADDPAAEKALDRAANRLYSRYLRNLPTLVKVHVGNRKGTYFGRLIAWEGPGTTINQLDDRITSFRKLHRANYSAWNTNDLAIGREAEDVHELVGASGLDIYRVTDHRHYISQGFPCLVHIDITLFENRIHMLALYRHQYLVTKAYGNLLGLVRLQRFLGQQTGYQVGELTMQAGFSDAEWNAGWGKTRSTAILELAESSLR